jgi:hypothetical protein
METFNVRVEYSLHVHTLRPEQITIKANAGGRADLLQWKLKSITKSI